MKNNKIQFGVVREDPQVELDLIAKYDLKSAVLIGSGGCTAFSLQAQNPKLKISLIEPNPAQTNLIEEKIKVLNKKNLVDSRKIIGTSKTRPLIESGNFESLFKMFREFIFEFIVCEKDLIKLFKSGSAIAWSAIFKNPYWATAFDLYFSDSMLVSIFGRDAIQYAAKGSYPNYFKNIIEKGVTRSDARNNYFLHHIFFGHYFSELSSLPLYLQKHQIQIDLNLEQCLAHEFKDYKAFELVSLSNILDWSNGTLVRKVAKTVSGSMKKGSVLIYRQLNNSRDFRAHFHGFRWQPKLARSAQIKDRSLFYSKICIGIKHE